MAHPPSTKVIAVSAPQRVATLKPCSRTPDPALLPPPAVPRLFSMDLAFIPCLRSAQETEDSIPNSENQKRLRDTVTYARDPITDTRVLRSLAIRAAHWA